MPIVRALPSAQSGGALLELRNDYHESVTVEDVFLGTRSSSPLTPLVAEILDIAPGNEAQYLSRGPREYDIHPDGQRFLMIKQAPQTEEASARAEIILVQNWSEELKRLVPTN